jgi:subtilisin-like proprotein convertase family protein
MTGPGTTGEPIARFLDADGRLSFPEGFSGTLDTKGFSIYLDECEGPVALPMTNNWSPLGTGLNGTCRALAVDGNGNIYAAGDFIQAGGQSANFIAKWDGTTWSPLGSGLSNRCHALAVDGAGHVYAGGDFGLAGGQSASRIAKWDGSSWSALGTGLNSTCRALAVDGAGHVYAGGSFNQAGGQSANFIAKWDGTTWSPLGTGLNGTCRALAVDGAGNVYAGGSFDQAGGQSAVRIAKWDGTTWSPLGTGLDNTCYALAVDGAGHVYAGGNFTLAGGQSAVRIAKWDGTAWSPLSSGLNEQCRALAVDGAGHVYAGGDFTVAGGQSANRIAKWDGSSWSPLGAGLSALCWELGIDGSGNVYAGGAFTVAGGPPANRIAKWVPPPCDIEITNVSSTDETCPYEEDGTITIDATCTTCTSILYSIDGGTTMQASNTFTNLAPGTYMPYVEDSGEATCTVDMGAYELGGQSYFADPSSVPLGPANELYTFQTTLNVPISGTIGTGVTLDQVTIDLTHTYIADLKITLIAPTGETLLLFDRQGNSGDNLTGTVFQDGGGNFAGSAPPYTGIFQPDGGTFASAFPGTSIQGDWILQIEDTAGGDSGDFLEGSISFTTDVPTGSLAITNSTCTDCTLSGGSIGMGTVSSNGAGTLEYSTDNGATWSSSLPAYDQDGPAQTILASVLNASGCRSGSVQVGVTEPGECVTPSAPTGSLSITNSTCADCTLSGGSIAIGTVSGMGGTLEYSTDNGATWSSSLPSYDQDGPAQTILASVLNASGCRSNSVQVGVTEPGECVVPAEPTGSLAITNSTCSDCTLSGGSIAIGTVIGMGGTLEYSTDNGAAWGSDLPSYDQDGPAQTILASVLSANGCRSNSTQVGVTEPGECTSSTATPNVFLEITNSTCTNCMVGGGSITLTGASGSSGETIEYSTNGGATWSSTLPTYNQTGPAQTILASILFDDGCRGPSIQVGETMPGECVTPAAPTGSLVITNSTCTDCTLSGGSIAIGTVSGIGGTLEYSTDNGAVWSSSLPAYDQDGPAQTILASVLSANGCRSNSTQVGVTEPGECTFSTATPNVSLEIINSTCNSCMVGGGSITIAGASGSSGETIEYSTNGGATWSSTLPTYNQTGPAQTILASILFDDGCRGPSIQVGETMPGECVTPAAPTGSLAITNSTCTDCTLSGGSIAIGTVSGIGGTLEYSTDNGAVWSSSLPAYDQDGPAQTILASVLSANGCRSNSVQVGVTEPGECVTSAAPTGSLAITNSTCTDCTLSGGSIAIGTVSGTGGTLEYSTDNGTIWNSSLPAYDQDGPVQTILASVIGAGGCRSGSTQVGVTEPGKCAGPSAICQSVTVALDGSGNYSLAASEINNGSSSDCGISSLSVSPNSFDCANIGNNTVTLTVTASNGNMASCTANVEVQDNMAPTGVTCQEATVSLDASGVFNLSFLFVTSNILTSFTDNCTPFPTSIGVGSPSKVQYTCEDYGTFPATFAFKDGNGNETPCTVNITVEDPLNTCCDISINNVVVADEGCPGANDGTLTATATCGSCDGGNSDIRYSIDNSDFSNTTGVFTALAPGTYTVYVRDMNNIDCTDSDGPHTVQMGMEIPAPTGTIAITNSTCTDCNLSGGTIAIGTVSGTGGTIEYSTDNGATWSSSLPVYDQDGPAQTILASVLSANGCRSNSVQVGVTEPGECEGPAAPTGSLSITNSTCTDCMLSGGSIAIGTVSGIGGMLEYSTDNGAAWSSDLPVYDQDGPAQTILASVLSASGCRSNSTQVGVTVPGECEGVVANCQNQTVELDADGNGTLLTSVLDDNSTGCGTLTFEFDDGSSMQNFDCLSAGQMIAFRLNVTDEGGQSSTCIATVTISDTEAPQITCPMDIVVDATSSAGAVVDYTAPVGTDNCTPSTVLTAGNDSGNIFPIGTTVNTFEVTDGAGNSNSCSFNVIVRNVAPEINCPEDITVSNDPGDCSAVVTFEATETTGIPASMITYSQDPGTAFPVGMTTVTATATNAGGSDECTFTVTVNDTEAPTIVCQDLTVYLDQTGSVNFNPLSSGAIISRTDNCALDGTPGVNDAPPGCISTFTQIITEFDISGNFDQCTVVYTILDALAPMAVCQNLTVQLDQSGQTTITPGQIDGGSTDNCAVSSLSLDVSNFDCDDIGANTVKLTAMDPSGNSSNCNATVTVEDNNPPTAVCNNPTVSLTSDGITTVAASFFDAGSSATCGSVDFSASMTEFSCDDVGNTYDITLTVTSQSSGLSDACTASVTVADPNSFCCAPPEAVCENITVQLDASGNASIIPADIGSSSTAECGQQSETLSDDTFDCTNVGANMVTYTITDINGDSDNCTANVTVEDNIAPSAVCLNTTVEIQPDGFYNLQQSDVYDPANSSDNCSIASVSFPATTFDCNDLGLTSPIVVTVTDPAGQTGNCTANVTITLGDALPPEWSASDIGDPGDGSDYNYDPCAANNPDQGDFTISTGGYNLIPQNSDNLAFATVPLCGNGGIQARIESVSGGYGGLMIRESSAPGAKMVAVYSNATNLLRRETRTVTNGPRTSGTLFAAFPKWLRLVRQGDYIRAFYRNSNGGNWTLFHQAYVPMGNCVEMGLAVFTTDPNGDASAVFSNVNYQSQGGQSLSAPSGLVWEAETPEVIKASVVPNPVWGQFTLQFSKPLPTAGRATLLNEFGQRLLQQPLRVGETELGWDAGALPAGLYFLEVLTVDGYREVLKVVRQ